MNDKLILGCDQAPIVRLTVGTRRNNFGHKIWRQTIREKKDDIKLYLQAECFDMMWVLGNHIESLLLLIYFFLTSRNSSSTWKVSKYTFLIHSTNLKSLILSPGENAILIILLLTTVKIRFLIDICSWWWWWWLPALTGHHQA